MGGLFLRTPLRLGLRFVDDWLNFLLERRVELEGFLKIRLSFFFFALVEAGDSAVDVGFRIAWLDTNHIAEVADRIVVLFDSKISQPAVVRRFSIFWLEANGLAVVLDGRFRFSEPGIRQPSIVVGIGIFRLPLDGFAEIINGLFLLSEKGISDAAIVISCSKL